MEVRQLQVKFIHSHQLSPIIFFPNKALCCNKNNKHRFLLQLALQEFSISLTIVSHSNKSIKILLFQLSKFCLQVKLQEKENTKDWPLELLLKEKGRIFSWFWIYKTILVYHWLISPLNLMLTLSNSTMPQWTLIKSFKLIMDKQDKSNYPSPQKTTLVNYKDGLTVLIVH